MVTTVSPNLDDVVVDVENVSRVQPDVLQAGLPDGTLSNQKSRFGSILEGLAMEDVGKLYGPLVYLRLFGIFCGHFIYFIVI
jgi:hypothetical protein